MCSYRYGSVCMYVCEVGCSSVFVHFVEPADTRYAASLFCN